MLQGSEPSLFDQLQSKVTGFFTDIADNWVQSVKKLGDAAKRFQSLYNQLLSAKSVAMRSPVLSVEYNDLLSKSTLIKNTTIALIDRIKSIYYSVTGQQDSGLGFVPLAAIPVWASVAAIGGVTASLVLISNRIISFLEKVRVFESTEKLIELRVETAKAAGKTPAQIDVIVSELIADGNKKIESIQAKEDGGFFEGAEATLKSASKFLLIGTVAWYGIPLAMKLFDHVGKKK